jgi:hypothetical protein
MGGFQHNLDEIGLIGLVVNKICMFFLKKYFAVSTLRILKS